MQQDVTGVRREINQAHDRFMQLAQMGAVASAQATALSVNIGREPMEPGNIQRMLMSSFIGRVPQHGSLPMLPDSAIPEKAENGS